MQARRIVNVVCSPAKTEKFPPPQVSTFPGMPPPLVKIPRTKRTRGKIDDGEIQYNWLGNTDSRIPLPDQPNWFTPKNARPIEIMILKSVHLRLSVSCERGAKK